MSSSTASGIFVAEAGPTSGREGIPKTVLDPKAIESWADDLFGKALSEHRFSGLGISVTEGDQALFQKGYGYQDWATKIPVATDRTQFRIGSLTKTFVATCILQLFERGQIKSLEDPANKYIKRFQFKPNGGEEVTVWDLLTHRAGFGHPKKLHVDRYAFQLPVPGTVLAAFRPNYVRPRDSLCVYCNYCFSMLGVIVEDVSRKTIADYLREEIFVPLGMYNTELHIGRSPTPDTIVQYAFVPNGPALALPYPPCPALVAPDGCIISTPADMSKWLIANINEGGQAANKVLAPSSWKLAHTRHRANHPDTNGFGTAFFIYNYNGEKVLEHPGLFEHRSMELMLMDSKVGIFITMAGGGEPGPRAEVCGAVQRAVAGPVGQAVSNNGARAHILEHFLGMLPFTKDPAADVSKYVGRYREIPSMQDPNSPYARGTIPGANEITVIPSGDGGLIIGGRGVYRPSGKDIFTLERTLELEAGYANRYIFETDAAGQIRALYQHVNAGGYERLN